MDQNCLLQPLVMIDYLGTTDRLQSTPDCDNCDCSENVETYSEDGADVNGEMKLEVDVIDCEQESASPIIVSPTSVDDVVLQGIKCRRSGRTAKRRSLLLPGELQDDVSAVVSKYCQKPSESGKDGVENGEDFKPSLVIQRVVEVKPDSSPPRTKRSYRPRNLQLSGKKKNVTQKSFTSVDELLGQLVSAVCGTDDHPANCQDCASRMEAIRALLQSSGKCGQDASATGDADITSSVSDDSHEPADTRSVGVGLFCCLKCSDRFDTFNELRKHAQLHTAGNKRKKCNVCHRYLAPSTSVTIHTRTHSGEKPFRCELCGALFAAAKTLREHRTRHTGDRPHRCTYCSRAFSRKSSLKVHVRTHTAELPYVCSDCGKGFAQSSLLKRHLLRVHYGQREVRTPKRAPDVGQDQIQTCPDCGKVLSGRSSMKAHRFLHTGARPFVCAVCSQSFTRYQHLVDHSVRHTGSRPHVCELCGAQFSRPSSLKVHRRLHTGETPYSCDVCGLSFVQSSNLQQHVRSHHTREKPYACSFCGERFAWSKDRISHERRRHTHDKPFSCDDCGRQFLTKYELRVHWQARHVGDRAPTGPRHLCSHCPATFVKKSSLARHIRKHFVCTGGDEETSAVTKEQWECETSVSGGHPQLKIVLPEQDHCQTAQRRQKRDAAVNKLTRNDIRTSSERPRQHCCPHCQLSCTTLASLSRHVRTHFGISDSEAEDKVQDQLV